MSPHGHVGAYAGSHNVDVRLCSLGLPRLHGYIGGQLYFTGANRWSEQRSTPVFFFTFILPSRFALYIQRKGQS